jgi:phosphate transport system permease protein
MDRRTTNNIALLVIKCLSAITIALLIIILGYLIYRGVWYQNQKEGDVLPISTSEEDFSLYATQDTKLSFISWYTLSSIAKGRERTLRTLTAVNEKIHFFVDASIREEAEAYLKTTIHDKYLVHNGTPQEIKGGIYLLKKGKTPPPGYKRIPLYDRVVAVNDSVTTLFNNRKIGSVTAEQVQELQQGAITNWKVLGGPDEKVTFIDRATEAQLKQTKGSVSIIEANSFAAEEGLDHLKVSRVEKGFNMSWDYLTTNAEESGAFGGIFSILINTLLMIILVLLISTPIGVGSAIYLALYAKKGPFKSLIRAGIDVLSGVPSIIFGLFGMLVFVQLFHLSFSLISGSLTLSLMILPTIIRTSEESINGVDKNTINASRGLGATKIESITSIVLPAAKKGIITGLILAMGRALGETAALVFTIGSSTNIATGFTSSSRVLAQHIYLTIIEGQSIDKAFASALILIILELIINSIAKKMLRGEK